MSVFIAIDIGGTHLRAACYPKDGRDPIKINRISTRAPNETPMERLISLVKSIWPADQEVEAIGVAAPGPINPYEGIIYTAPNIPGWDNVHLVEDLKGEFDTQIFLGNDANLAALGEWCFGAGQGHHHLIYITVSTGIGSGIIINDELLLGSHGLAAELGHITVMTDGPLCGCGKTGHLEAVASGTGIARWTKEQLQQGVPSKILSTDDLTAEKIAEAARKNDRLAISAFNRAGKFIGQAITDFLHIFNPSIVIIGGGVSSTGELIMDPIRSTINQRVISSHYLEDLKLTTADLGDEVGLLGALVLARQNCQ
jgi:glucokinase